MNQSPKPATVGETAAGWEQRLRAHPEVLPQIAVLLDSIELKHAATATADQAETGGRVAVQQLGQNVLRAWAAQRCVRARYGASLGSVVEVGALWEQTARAAGLGPPSRVHGVGDGAPWIAEQFDRHFAPKAFGVPDGLLPRDRVPRRRRAAPTKPRPRRCATVSVSCARGGRNWTTPARWRPASRLAPD